MTLPLIIRLQNTTEAAWHQVISSSINMVFFNLWWIHDLPSWFLWNQKSSVPNLLISPTLDKRYEILCSIFTYYMYIFHSIQNTDAGYEHEVSLALRYVMSLPCYLCLHYDDRTWIQFLKEMKDSSSCSHTEDGLFPDLKSLIVQWSLLYSYVS